MAASIAALGYHDVADERTTSGFQRPGAWPYKLTRHAFDEHLWAIASVTILPTLVHHVVWDAPGKQVMLTFDDGGASAPYIGETLVRHGWRAHFFITTSLIGTPGFIDAAGIRALQAQGHVVGSHSHTHPDIFRDLSPARMKEEWTESRNRLSDLLGEPCDTASVPGGDVSSAVLRSAAEAGYAYVFTSEPDPRPAVEGLCRVLGRFVVKASHTADQVARLARGEGWQQALFLRRLRVSLTRALPGLYRQYVAFRTHAHES
jgi:peptidoglycan/xylan/chitin deacetylase (PgdA/CDA1 family)